PLAEVCRGETENAATLLLRTDYGQALLFALELALAQTLEEDHGVTPILSFGHSLGELGAAAFAGAISIADACRVVAARGLLMQQLTPEGAMLSVRGSREVVDSVVHSTPGLEYAAFNGPGLFSLSGPPAILNQASDRLREKGLKPKHLAVTRAFHSSLMDPMLAPFSKVLDEVKFQAPRFPLLSGLTGELVKEGEYNKAYWLRQVLEPTQFQGMIESAAKAGINIFLEIGPQPVITAMGPECVPNQALRWLCPLAKADPNAFPKTLAELTALGARRYPKRGGTGPLPFTPFSHRISGDLPMADANTLLNEFQLLVANLLQVSPPEVDPDTNLVDMGADSLLLLNAIQTIKDRHGVSIGVAE
ncbi:MAG: acyltransferase domain-containing protein, partial [Proteobacteria bacterium]